MGFPGQLENFNVSLIMNTPAHMMLNVGLLGKGRVPRYQIVVLIGAVISDVPMFVFYFWEKVWRAFPESEIWQHYFDPSWQIVFDLFHSFPIAIVGGLLSLWAKCKGWTLFWASMILHNVGDFPLHHDDAHRHFIPLSDWQFASPVSYWDPRFYGDVVTIIEILMVLAIGLWLWRDANWVGTKIIVASIFSIYLGSLGYVVLVWI